MFVCSVLSSFLSFLFCFFFGSGTFSNFRGLWLSWKVLSDSKFFRKVRKKGNKQSYQTDFVFILLDSFDHYSFSVSSFFFRGREFSSNIHSTFNFPFFFFFLASKTLSKSITITFGSLGFNRKDLGPSKIDFFRSTQIGFEIDSATMIPSASLDSWRDYFRRGDSDIFGIINHAIMVAATDCPIKFRSRRDKIAELLYSCRVSRCTGCDHLELSVPGDDDANLGRGTTGTGIGEEDRVTAVNGDENKANSSRGENNHIDEMNLKSNQIVSNYTYDEAEALSDAIEEFSAISKEVYRIKEILLNKEDEPNSVLLDSLRKLKLMSLNVDILKSTAIGKAVNGLRKHGSDQIRQLAKTLIAEWKEIVDQWVNTTKEITGAEGTPDSANPSVVDEEEAFPSLPYDVDIFTPEPNGFEISHFFDSLDFDGNPRNTGEYNASLENGRRPQNIAKRRPEGTQMRKQDAHIRSIKPSSATDLDDTRRPLKQNTEQRMKNEMVSVHKSDKPIIQRKPVVTEQKQKAPVPQQQKLKGLDADARFEFAKRKLQESYQHHENAKKQRTIQVLEMIPKQGSSQKPQLKRPGMNNRNWANGRK